MFSFTSAWTNGWINNRGASELRHHCAYHNVTVILLVHLLLWESGMLTHHMLYFNADWCEDSLLFRPQFPPEQPTIVKLYHCASMHISYDTEFNHSVAISARSQPQIERKYNTCNQCTSFANISKMSFDGIYLNTSISSEISNAYSEGHNIH